MKHDWIIGSSTGVLNCFDVCLPICSNCCCPQCFGNSCCESESSTGAQAKGSHPPKKAAVHLALKGNSANNRLGTQITQADPLIKYHYLCHCLPKSKLQQKLTQSGGYSHLTRAYLHLQQSGKGVQYVYARVASFGTWT